MSRLRANSITLHVPANSLEGRTPSEFDLLLLKASDTTAPPDTQRLHHVRGQRTERTPIRVAEIVRPYITSFGQVHDSTTTKTLEVDEPLRPTQGRMVRATRLCFLGRPGQGNCPYSTQHHAYATQHTLRLQNSQKPKRKKLERRSTVRFDETDDHATDLRKHNTNT